MLYGIREGHRKGCRRHFPAVHLEMDHVIPRSKGVADHTGNFQLLCGPCNNLKRDRPHEHLIADLAKLPTQRWAPKRPGRGVNTKLALG